MRTTDHRLRVPLGKHADTGAVVWLDLEEYSQGGQGPHGLLISGPRSHGRDLCRSIIHSLTRANSPDQLHIWIIDAQPMTTPSDLTATTEWITEQLPGSDLSVLTAGLVAHNDEYGRALAVTALPHVQEVISEPDIRVAVDRLGALVDSEVQRRETLLGNVRARDYSSYLKLCREGPAGPHRAEDLPALVISVEAFPAIVDCADGARILKKLGSMGRALGIYVLLSAGRLPALAAYVAKFVNYRIALHADTDSCAALGLPDACRLDDPRAGYLRDADSVVQFVF